MGNISEVVKKVANNYQKDPTKMLDVIRDTQAELGQVSDEAIKAIAKEMNVSTVDVEGVVTFYHFFSKKPVGKYAVYLNNSAVSVMKGCYQIAKVFEQEVGCKFGEVSADGKIGLHYTSDIGMNDQEPAAIINGVIFTSLTSDKVKAIVADMKAGKAVKDMVKEYGDGKNQAELIKAMVKNNIQKKGPVLFAPFTPGSALKKALSMTPEQVIEEVKISNLRGRGGAGFPTGMKWDFTRQAKGDKKYIVCNGDEGEPGTFKDRVIFTEIPEMMFEGMAIAGYAIGADEGLLYLRGEYMYLKNYLEDVLSKMRQQGILGKNAGGKAGFNFDIKIQMGAGAYVCGEESALIESAEGKRGEPRNRPPFPAQRGFMGKPTSVNNVESFCCAARIILEGGEWFAKMGTAQSKGTKLLSVSGDCKKPGIYEVEFGTTIQTLLEECDGRGAKAVQVGGPSGVCVDKSKFGQRICYDDLATGGSIIVIGPDRDLFEVVHNFMEFFEEESCGWCTPCRVGNQILLHKLEKVMSGHGTETDLKEMEQWCVTVKSMSRCGLGQTSPNPIYTTLKNFREMYEAKIQKGKDYATEFDLAAAVKDSCAVVGRKPNLGEH
ncbi:MAG TPA: NAD(P)H-dependent oxidoreductase subunit E [Spirochaetota bacterium]|jgi:[NiFe] hydrogenase diaphorase moiety large subunit|nr:NAD(P)H-dependent oxidoreductase subunit E [Spirochaetota bacterium]OQB00200.1 MAG: NAD-reducing hydrogenase HoxS subunit alpha [Spirochaetes bacterium ADurb.Bin218]HOK01982.1 NAD(P)H-dependent oxidoreductase subunit E [Spirochaetota bacterium]HOK92181.1 NAD(P)H-dependent oxidoreductase subunit E [Spirochaetota bacterium]HOQ12014.1 NAD(P)H-dependent oxidoreductase subunit E [Spirochaetota bacterium]